MEPSLPAAEATDQPQRDAGIIETDTDRTQNSADLTSIHDEDDDDDVEEEAEEDDTSAAMRAAMGFSSFGVDKKKPTEAARSKAFLSSAPIATGTNATPIQGERADKKRKLSARFEAVVAAAPPSSAPGHASADTARRVDAGRGEAVGQKPSQQGHGLPPKPQFAGTDAAPGVSLPTVGKQTAMRNNEDTRHQGMRGGSTGAAEGYFSPSFIEDPWEPLLAARARVLGQSS